VIVLGIFGCKQNPSFSVENSNDPLSENFSVLPPSNLEISMSDEGITLEWEASPSELFSGYLVYRSRDNAEEFQLIAELPSENTSYLDVPDWNLIDVEYKVEAYFDKPDSSRILSSELNTGLSQEIEQVIAYLNNENEIIFEFVTTFGPFSEFTIEQKIGDQPYELLGNLSSTEYYFAAQYDELPNESLTYRVFVENEFTRTEETNVVPEAYFSPPAEFFLNSISEQEVEVSCVDYNEPVSELILFMRSQVDTTFTEIDQIPDCSIPFEITSLSYDESYEFRVTARKGPFYSWNFSYFDILSQIGPKELLSTPIVTDGLATVKGDISSDNSYATLTLNDQEQYAFDLNTLELLDSFKPRNRGVVTELVELDNEAFYVRSDFPSPDTGPLALFDFQTQQSRRNFPSLKSGEYIFEIEFIRGTSYLVYFSIFNNGGASVWSVNVYDLKTSQLVDTLISSMEQSYFKIASSDKSILIYDDYTDDLHRFSIDDFSDLGTLNISSWVEHDVIFMGAETDPSLITPDNDYYYFKVQFSEVFGMDMENPSKEIIDVQNGSNDIYQFGSSRGGELKCAVSNSFSESVLNCFDQNFNKTFTIDTESRVAGFLLPENDEFVFIVTEDEVAKFAIEDEYWSIINKTDF
jgi:hypothetical protein